MTPVDRPSTPSAGPELPFFVYGTLRPGEVNHDLFLRGRTAAEVPARLPDAVLYDGPGYPYAVQRAGGEVVGELVTPAPGRHPELLAELDRLEEYYGPGLVRNLYERVVRRVLLADGGAVEAWVYLAAPSLARRLTTTATPIPTGNWLHPRP
ncbi:gamma-glutamylcyclotransferase family protein [Streptomyces sp. NBC_00239]|uniref:gamma-glutamylcyclotransferase family protein n=1 Tax=Streptomyces sp. NBC_00239 TaxID=2903640 RepID=UPI002E2CD303|nr:gamma-glutamylcyclotransferase family protein [Streptomyces sp. NBC_00239]